MRFEPEKPTAEQIRLYREEHGAGITEAKTWARSCNSCSRSDEMKEPLMIEAEVKSGDVTPRRRMRLRGFTLIELVLVVAVGIGLLVGATLYFQKAQADGEVRDAIDRIAMIRAEVASQYAGKARRNWRVLDDDAAEPLGSSAFALRSGLPPETFRGMRLRAGDIIELYRIELYDLEPAFCQRLAGSDHLLADYRYKQCQVVNGRGQFYVSYGTRSVGAAATP